MSADGVRRDPAQQLDADDPWPGLDSYTEASQLFFSGRAAEIEEMLRRVLDDSVLVLFGKSGLGKTSLLRAGLFPRLRDKGHLPIYVRLRVESAAPPLPEQLRLALAEELVAQNIDHPAWEDGETLWEYLHRAGLELWTKQNRLVKPIFVFDQFEELFTLGRAMPAEVERFRETLADLAENRIPAGLARRLDSGAVLAERHDRQARIYKVLISLREDFLADLEGWRLVMPSLRRNRMRLFPMGPEQALQAVRNERTAHLVPEPIARKIVAFLSQGVASPGRSAPASLPTVDGNPSSAGDPFAEGSSATIEPALLSLFCRGVNEHRKRDGKSQFDDALLEGGKGTIVTDFYRTSLKDQPERVKRFIEEELITEHGFRNSYSVDDALAGGAVKSKELEALVNRRLLRREHHLGTERVELTHDLLTKTVLEERVRRRAAERLVIEARKRRKLWIGIWIGLTLGVAIASGLLYLTVQASRSEQRAKAGQLVAQSRNVVDKDPHLALLLAREALSKGETFDARSALLSIAQYTWPVATLDRTELDGTAGVVALSSDGSRLAILNPRQNVSLWDVSQRQPALLWERTAKDAVSIAMDGLGRIAVGRRAAVDLLDGATGKVTGSFGDLESPVEQVAFRPDGSWLAVVQEGASRDACAQFELRRWDMRLDAPVEGERAPAESMGTLALLANGEGIVYATASPLAAHRLDREPGGREWRKEDPDLAECVKPQSITPGALNLSVTYRSTACIIDWRTHKVQVTQDKRSIADIVWSGSGAAFVEMLVGRFRDQQDLVVGAGDPATPRSESWIKGSPSSGTLSVSDDGRRLAVAGGNASDPYQVEVYSLGDHKPLLSRLGGPIVVALDGSWAAIQHDTAQTTDGASSGPKRMEVIRLDQGRGQQFEELRSIDLPARAELYPAKDAVLAVLRGTPDQPTQSLLYNVYTGAVRPFDGEAILLGTEGELLLVRTGGSPKTLVVRARDGAEVARGEAPLRDLTWSEPCRSPMGDSYWSVSPNRQVIAIQQPGGIAGLPGDLAVFRVRGERLIPAGELRGVPDNSAFAVADDATSVTESRVVSILVPLERYCERATLMWSITDTRPTEALDVSRALNNYPEEPASFKRARQRNSRSPQGGFEVQPVDTAGASGGLKIVRLRDEKVVLSFNEAFLKKKTFSPDDRWFATVIDGSLRLFDLVHEQFAATPDLADADVTYAFSPDSRWFVIVGDGSVRLFDLVSEQFAAALDLADPVAVGEISFEGGAQLLKLTFGNGNEMLVPVDPHLTDRFVDWLAAGRKLTKAERCLYGLDSGDCRDQSVATRPPGKRGTDPQK